MHQCEAAYLVLSIELETRAAVEPKVAEEASLNTIPRISSAHPHSIVRNTNLVSAPAEHRQRHRNGDIDPDLPDIHFRLELARRGARLREDARTIAVAVSVDDGDRIVERVGFEAEEDWAEDLGPALHLRSEEHRGKASRVSGR